MKSWPTVSLPELPAGGEHLRLWNALTGLVEPTEMHNHAASLYVCGITPYDSTHMGHAATYVTFDMVNRVWRDAGVTVRYAQNVTDIDDPLLERAAKVNLPWEDIAQREVSRFKDDMVALRVLPPDSYVLVTEHMEQIVVWISQLVAAGLTYFVDSDLYFDSSIAELGSVSHLTKDEMLTIFAQRGGDPERSGKRNALDPLLWRGKREGEPSWGAPFGPGRPGWHIECVAIAADSLGRPITIQGGGSDLMFPHHDMCQAQSRALDGTAFADGFAYAAMVSYQGEKMSKSLGNLVFISELVHSGVDPMAIRLAILSSHYREPWEWTDQRLERSQERLDVWRTALAMQGGAAALSVLADVRSALADDLDTPRALSLIDAWAHETLQGNSEDDTAQGLIARLLDTLLGISL